MTQLAPSNMDAMKAMMNALLEEKLGGGSDVDATQEKVAQVQKRRLEQLQFQNKKLMESLAIFWMSPNQRSWHQKCKVRGTRACGSDAIV